MSSKLASNFTFSTLSFKRPVRTNIMEFVTIPKETFKHLEKYFWGITHQLINAFNNAKSNGLQFSFCSENFSEFINEIQTNPLFQKDLDPIEK